MSTQKPPDPPPDDIYTKLNIFRPACEPASRKKHPCRDCFACQFCSDARCAICLAGQGKRCCRSCATDTTTDPPTPPKKDEPA